MESMTDQIRKNWMMLVFISGMILWYGNTNSRLTAVEAQQIEQATIEEKVDQLITDVAVIKNILSTQTAQTVSNTKTANTKIDDLGAKIDLIIKKVD